jgi:hypothetical protein
VSVRERGRETSNTRNLQLAFDQTNGIALLISYEPVSLSSFGLAPSINNADHDIG